VEHARIAPNGTATTLSVLLAVTGGTAPFQLRNVPDLSARPFDLARPSAAINTSPTWANSSTVALEEPPNESVWSETVELESPRFVPSQLTTFAARGFRRLNRR